MASIHFITLHVQSQSVQRNPAEASRRETSVFLHLAAPVWIEMKDHLSAITINILKTSEMAAGQNGAPPQIINQNVFTASSDNDGQ